MPNFQIPEKINVEKETYSDKYGQFTIEPLERGFGTTIGNALRRILLSSIPGAAITAVRIESVLHEFATIDGVLEDVSAIILNLKQVKINLEDSKPIKLNLDFKGPVKVTAGMLVDDEDKVEILNPDLQIFEIVKEKEVKITLWIGRGRGYYPAEQNKTIEAPVDTIWIDSIFSPVTKVSYVIEKLQAGEKKELEKLVIDVHTNGAISPEDSLSYAAKLLTHHIEKLIDLKTSDIIEPEVQIDEEKIEMKKKLNKKVDELELSVRAYHCLKNANIDTIGELVQKDEDVMLKHRNFGRKSLNELIQKLNQLDLRFGMDVAEYLDNDNDNDNNDRQINNYETQ
ncbi:MAG: DNA-directed RNA polymerase subunit alpha [Candidatus Marinimicrobia bacterium]|nr:DNA-directed RNA polymerase subunit alpha [Candidatus Neomarinimicrobiota bacterium]